MWRFKRNRELYNDASYLTELKDDSQASDARYSARGHDESKSTGETTRGKREIIGFRRQDKRVR